MGTYGRAVAIRLLKPCRQILQTTMDRITELENENLWLKEEIRRLRHQLAVVKKEEWAHPESCVYNSDPWETWLSN